MEPHGGIKSMNGTIYDNNRQPLTDLQADDYMDVVGTLEGKIDLSAPDFLELHQTICDFVRTPTIRSKADRED
jgi:hypothetical protein